MSRRALHAADGEGFLRAFTDEWQDLEAVYRVQITTALGLTGRKGVLRVVLVAMDARLDGPVRVKAKYSVEYPTAAVATFEAALFQAMTKLERMLYYQGVYPSGLA